MRRHALYAGCTLMLVTAATIGSNAQPLKCSRDKPPMFPNAPEPTWVLNGRAADSAAIRAVHADSIDDLAIICADVAYRVFQVEAHRNVIVVFTKPGPTRTLKAALETVKELQSRYHEKNGRFASTAAELGWSDSTGMMTMDIVIADDRKGWTAHGNHHDESCSMCRMLWKQNEHIFLRLQLHGG